MSIFNIDNLLEATPPAITTVPEDQQVLGSQLVLPEFDLALDADGLSMDVFEVEASAEFETTLEAIRMLEVTEATMEMLDVELQQSIVNGGFDAVGYQGFDARLTAVTSLFGGIEKFDTPDSTHPELTHESFEDAGLRIGNTEVTHEKMKERIGQVGKIIQNAVRRLMDAFERFNEQFIIGLGRQEAKVEELRELIKTAKGKPIESEVSFGGKDLLTKNKGKIMVKSNDLILVGRMIKDLAKEKGISQLVDQIATVAKEAKIDENNTVQMLSQQMQTLRTQFDTQIVSALQATETFLESTEGADKKVLKRLGLGRLKHGRQGGTSFNRIVRTPELPGGRSFYCVLPKEDSQMTVTVVFSDYDNKNVAPETLKALSLSECTGWISSASSIIKDCNVASPANRLTARAFKDLVVGVKNMSNTLNDAISSGTEQEQDSIKRMTKDIRQMAATIATTNKQLLKYAVSCSAAACKYVTVSVNNHGE